MGASSFSLGQDVTGLLIGCTQTDRQTHTVIVRQFRQFNGGRPTEKAVKTNEWDFRGKSSAAVDEKASARMISAGGWRRNVDLPAQLGDAGGPAVRSCETLPDPTSWSKNQKI